ncbi:glutathione S-transferase [Lacticaseibacillus zeae]|uniref:Glutathione S-transferase n=1 Tax=Lacticaseibacillus zeae TaxID=57037 RepID=A0A5R8LKK5_LACZE|nr:glutathione binding-like protein [Lacticaseibacillus zeae]TLF37749.1 glutathione S-transferase [Lacticaseibacillus zeae]
MLRLFYASGTSAMAPHILLTDAGLDFEAEKVNLDRKTWRGGDYNQINPKSYVPTLQVSPSTYLTECAVILEYIARKAKGDYRSSEDSLAYWQERMWLNYIATELHKNFISPFRRGNWLPNTADSKKLVWQRVAPRLQYVEERFKGPWLMGKRFSMADPYLFVMTNWMRRLEFSFGNLPKLQMFDERMRERTSVQEVLRVEGRPHSVTDG